MKSLLVILLLIVSIPSFANYPSLADYPPDLVATVKKLELAVVDLQISVGIHEREINALEQKCG